MDIEKIEQLIQVVKGSEVSELSLESDGGAVRIRKGHAPKLASKAQSAGPAKKPGKAAESAQVSQPAGPKEAVVIAPMVGIFHSFNGAVAVGKAIRAGQVVGSIESMKLMNDISSDADGQVAEVLVEDGMPVEYGQALLRLVCE